MPYVSIDYTMFHNDWSYVIIELPSRKTIATYDYSDEDSQERALRRAKMHLEELDAFTGDRFTTTLESQRESD